MPELIVYLGLDGSGRAEAAGRAAAAGGLALAHTREEALRFLRYGLSCALDVPDMKARGRRDLVERAKACGARTLAVLTARPLGECVRRAPERAEEIRAQYRAFCPPQPPSSRTRQSSEACQLRLLKKAQMQPISSRSRTIL